MKICKTCGESKPLEEFHKQTKAKDGKQSSCKVCNKKNVTKWQTTNPEYWLTQKNRSDRIAAQRRSRIYGLSVKEIQDLLLTTECQICSKDISLENKHIDHDHDTGQVRGVLCGVCNRGLGHFKDNVELLKKAIEYLEGSNPS